MKNGAKYDHAAIEKKWQRKWASSKIYESDEDAKKAKYYVLDMFPYPSGEGLHVGHPKGYIATDVVSRMKRMQGYSVLHPMGFDAFGLPAENYALKTKTNPADSVAKNVERFKKQLEIIGLDYDWSREIVTTDPEYFRWTQWIFLQLLKKGLAYESYEPINWCPVDKTGLANEDVENGRCERCGALVEKKLMRQWVLKITDYADRLLKDLDARTAVGGDLIEGNNDEPCFVQMIGPSSVRQDLPFVERNAICAIVKHWSEDKYIGLKWKKVAWQTFITGGQEGDESSEEAARREIIEETGYQRPKFIKHLGKVHAKFFHVPKKVNRLAHFDYMYFELADGEHCELSDEEKSNHEVVWLTKDEVIKFLPPDSQKYMWEKLIGKPDSFTSPKPLLDWPESIKEAQRNWIGRSEGALIKFSIINGQPSTAKASKEIEVFTTRPDTLFGVTYVVLAPEHKLVGELLEAVSNKKEVTDYIASAKLETEIERTDEKKEKTGVQLKGVNAINPANNESVPVWISDYVLADYGTGAVMAVPAHDERDGEFAKKFGLAVQRVIEPKFVATKENIKKYYGTAGDDVVRPELEYIKRDSICAVVRNPKDDTYLCMKWKTLRMHGLVTGGIDEGENPVETAKREVREETGYKNITLTWDPDIKINTLFYHRLKNQNRWAHFTILFFDLVDEEREPIDEKESAQHESLWLKKDELKDFFSVFEATFALQLLDNRDFVFVGNGVMSNSGTFTGRDSESVKKEITASVTGKWVTKYKLRDWVFSRQRYWGEPIPVIHCENCRHTDPAGHGIIPVPEKDLPVVLPRVKSYEPTGTGESPLAAIEKWVNVKCPKCGGAAKRETNTMPQWAGSSWYHLRFMDPKNKKALVDPRREKYWSPVDLYVGGAEHATRHLIYARFWHKFLYDIGAVSTIEPFIKLQSVGLIMGEDGRKMSKRFGNVVNPDDIVARFGADTLRVYEMFMGPFDQQIAWSTDSMVGARRFIEKVWRIAGKAGDIEFSTDRGLSERPPAISRTDASFAGLEKTATSPALTNIDLTKTLHKTIKKVTEDIGALKFNTAISTLMIAVNEFEKAEAVSREQFELLLQILAPFAPHISEELWSILGNKKSIHTSDWPKYDPKLIVDDEVRIIVQVNGKMRGSFMIEKDAPEKTVEAAARGLPEVQKWLEGKVIKKTVIVPNKLVSLVV